jgi:hypothetical protein
VPTTKAQRSTPEFWRAVPCLPLGSHAHLRVDGHEHCDLLRQAARPNAGWTSRLSTRFRVRVPGDVHVLSLQATRKRCWSRDTAPTSTKSRPACRAAFRALEGWRPSLIRSPRTNDLAIRNVLLEQLDESSAADKEFSVFTQTSGPVARHSLPLRAWKRVRMSTKPSSVRVWSWHLELTWPVGKHRADGEHGGCVAGGLGEGDDVGLALGLHRRAVHVDVGSNDGLGDAPAVDSVDVSWQAATDGATTPRSDCSSAWAAA